MRRIPIAAYLEALFATATWGGTFIATKLALQEASPATLVFLRFGMGVLILGAAVLLRRQFALPSRNEWGYFALVGFIGVTFHQWLQATGLQTAAATTTALDCGDHSGFHRAAGLAVPEGTADRQTGLRHWAGGAGSVAHRQQGQSGSAGSGQFPARPAIF